MNGLTGMSDDWGWANPAALGWLVVVPVLATLIGFLAWSKRRMIRRYFSDPLIAAMLPMLDQGREWAAASSLVALTLLILSAADPRWGESTREVPQRGIEVMFLLDVSRSMLATDITPNRLTRAKQQIKDVVDELVGDRVGLIVFAGESKQVVPLTSHLDEFKQRLDELGPHSLRRGGSRLGDAISVASDSFLEPSSDHHVVVIFTDGEDQESDPVGRARQASQLHGVRIVTVGLGDEVRGSRIPESESTLRRRRGSEFVEEDGQPVWSRLNGAVLSEVAAVTGGLYVPAGTKRVDMAEVVRRTLSSVPQTEFETAQVQTRTVRFQWFATPALAILLLAWWLSQRSGAASSGKRAIRTAATLAVICSLATSTASAQTTDVAAAINEANAQIRSGEFTGAIEQLQSIVPPESLRDAWHYNLGIALASSGDLGAAVNHWQQSATSADTNLAISSRNNLGHAACEAAKQTAASDTPSAIQSLHQAIGHYRDSLRLSPDQSEIRGQIELAARWIEELQHEPPADESPQESPEEKPDVPQPSDDESTEPSEGEQPNESEQGGDSEQNPSPESMSDESSDDGSGNDGEPDSAPEPSEAESEPAGEGEDPAAEPSTAPPSPHDAGGQEPSAEDAGDDGEAGAEDPEPADTDGRLTPADVNVQNDVEQERADPVEAPAAMTLSREEALKMLQAVRDREMLRRLIQQRREQQRQIPVERDW